VHKGETISLLSSEATKQADYRGFINLAILFFLVANARLVIDNLTKYGWMLKSPVDVIFDPLMLQLGAIAFGYIAFTQVHYAVERFIAPSLIKFEPLIILIQVTLLLIGWTFPIVIAYTYDTYPPLTMGVLLVPSTGSTKMISFIHTCYNMRYLYKR
jgi:hypothetical protein